MVIFCRRWAWGVGLRGTDRLVGGGQDAAPAQALQGANGLRVRQLTEAVGAGDSEKGVRWD